VQEIIHDYPVISALVVYGLWTLSTYLLEGRLKTLLRPEATYLRLWYALIANLGIGLLFSGWILYLATQADVVSENAIGFGSLLHSVVWTCIAAVIGLAIYQLQNPSVRHPMVVWNGFSQVWVVSTAEVMVCWAVVGGMLEDSLKHSADLIAVITAAVIASLLFGIYHIAHSPPFNTLAMIGKLTVVGTMTSLFFFLSRSFYGTLVFHNFLALYGVLQALQRADHIDQYRKPIMPLSVMAAISLLLLLGIDLIWL
jgi:hypothetical protein